MIEKQLINGLTEPLTLEQFLASLGWVAGSNAPGVQYVAKGWNARQSEIDTLRARVEELERSLSLAHAVRDSTGQQLIAANMRFADAEAKVQLAKDLAVEVAYLLGLLKIGY